MANLWIETGLVFTNVTGGPMDPETATKSFQRVLRREGLPYQRFHDLRHACASLLLAQGLDLKVIQEILGHRTITITADLYAHVMMGANTAGHSANGRDARGIGPVQGFSRVHGPRQSLNM